LKRKPSHSRDSDRVRAVSGKRPDKKGEAIMAHRTKALFIDEGDEDRLQFLCKESSSIVIDGDSKETDFFIVFKSDEQAFAFARKAVELIEAAISEKRVEGDAHND